MRIVRAAIIYSLTVFGAGFALALIRLPLLVPRLGVRTAELLEMPFMLAVILWAARRLVHRNPDLGRGARLLCGMLALLLLVGAELLVAFALGSGSITQYVASRDPVSGSVYAACLLIMAMAPGLWKPRRAR
ncbi:MAG: hypothetical protein WCD66_02920 [Rhodanobacteraceae bacterium]